MKCKLIFYCALIFYLESVASLPYAFNVPRYPIQYNAELPPERNDAQSYWNQRTYNPDRYNYPNEQYKQLPIVNRDQNHAYRQQENVFNNRLGYVERYPIQQRLPNSIPKWPLQNEWQKINRETIKSEPIQHLEESPLTKTDRQYFSYQDTKNRQNNVSNLKKSYLLGPLVRDNLIRKPHEISQANKLPPPAATLERFDPPIPAIPTKSLNQAAIDNFEVIEKNIPIKQPLEIKEKIKSTAKMSNDSDERFFATSTNPIETKPTPTPDPIKNHIKQIISNSKIREMISSRKSPSRYLVVYPNGTIERVNTLQTIAEQHPNYVLVHAGNLVAKPIHNFDQVDISPTTATAILKKSTIIKESAPNDFPPKEFPPKEYLPKESPRKDYLTKEYPPNDFSAKESSVKEVVTNKFNNITIPFDIQRDISPSTSALSPAPPNTTLSKDSVPLETHLRPDGEDGTSPIEIPPRTGVQPANSPTIENKKLDNAEPPTRKTRLPLERSSNISVVPVETPSIAEQNSTQSGSPIMKTIETTSTNISTITAEQVSLPIAIPPEETLLPVEVSQIPIQIESPKAIAQVPLPEDLLLDTPNTEITPVEILPTKTDSIPFLPEIVLNAVEILPNSLQVGSSPVELPIFSPVENTEKVQPLAVASVATKVLTSNNVDDVTPDILKDVKKTNPEDSPKKPLSNDEAPNNPSSILSTVEVTTAYKDSSRTETLTTTTVTPVTDTTKEINTTLMTDADISSTTPVPVKENNETIVLPSLIKPILLNVPENKTVPYLPGNLDISKLKSDGKPFVWFKTTDDSFWNKLAGGKNDFDIVYFFQINNPPKVENDLSRTIYPNGTIVEVLTKKEWDPDSGQPTITKTTQVIQPNVLPQFNNK